MPRGSRRAAQRLAALEQLKSGDEPGRPLGLPAGERHEDGFTVRSLSGAAATKTYRCPGCDQELPAGTPHVVVWPDGRADERRHWHTACWSARSRRRLTRKR